MAAPQPHFSPKQVASALQASESSVKRWCDQGAIATVRTVGGHRKISLDSLQQFLRESKRSLIAPQALGLTGSSASSGDEIPGGQQEERRIFRSALARGDEVACRRILREHVEITGSRSRSADYLITDAMHGIGEAWDCRRLDAYQERRGCDICIRLMNELRAEIPPLPRSAPIAVGGTPAGDPYQIPTALVELTLRESGWNATSLGYNLPVESFLKAIEDYRPDMVWLSVSSFANVEQFVEDENRLALDLGQEVALLVGGRALDETLRGRLRYTACCDSLQDLADFSFMLRMSKTH